MSGWIKIHRTILTHWIWQDPVKLKWWLDILLNVNHEDVKVNLGFEIYECKRGQTVRSLQKWAERWSCNKDTARNFLRLLEKDGMILHDSLPKTTRITVCNYDNYQGCLHDIYTDITRSANDRQTVSDLNKKDKKDKKGVEIPAPLNFDGRQKLFLDQLSQFKGKFSNEMLNSFYNYWSEKTRTGEKMRWEKQETWELSKRLTTWNLKDQKYKK